MFKRLFLFFILFFCFTQCTIQKRTVNKGYFVQWNIGEKVLATNSKVENTKQEQTFSVSPFVSNVAVDDIIVDEEKVEVEIAGNESIIVAEEKENKAIVLSPMKLKQDVKVIEKKTKHKVIKSNNSKPENEEKQFRKKRLRLALIFALSTVFYAIIIFLFFLANIYGWSLISFFWFQIISILSYFFIIPFAILALVFLLLAFSEPKEKKTQKAQT